MFYVTEKIQNSKTLEEIITKISVTQAGRFSALTGKARVIAERNIQRHLNACQRLNVLVGSEAIKEILDDAGTEGGIFSVAPARGKLAMAG